LYYPLILGLKITEVRDRMFDLNETINWKPKSTGKDVLNWIKTLMTGTYLVQDIKFLYRYGELRTSKKKF
jgi:hypothetical protein